MTSQQGHDRLCMGSEHLISGCKFGEKGPKLFIYAKLQHKGIGESYPALRVCKTFLVIVLEKQWEKHQFS